MIIPLSSDEVRIIKEEAKKTLIGGKSQIFKTRSPEELYEHQYIMHCGEAALSKCLTGDIKAYIETRKEKNKTPYKGDNGSDLLGYSIDIKTSKKRTSLPDRKHHLYVRDKEYHPNVIYVLALLTDYKTVNILGWIEGKDMPKSIDGRREILGEKLISLEKLNEVIK